MKSTGFSLPGRERRPEERWQAHVMDIGDGYIEAMGIRLLNGREFARSDTLESQRVMIINEVFASDHFPGEDPIDRNLLVDGKDHRIVGVCAPTLYNETRGDWPSTMYFPSRQRATETLFLAVRTAVQPLSLVPAVRHAVAEIDPLVPLARIATQAELLNRSLFLERLFLTLCGALAVMALLLSCIGLYGLMAYSVARRRAEIGVRMALGALPVAVARLIVREALTTTTWGLIVGLPLAIAVGFTARGAFFGVAPYDPASMTAAAALLLGVTVLAAWLPARRAAQIDPMAALRAE